MRIEKQFILRQIMDDYVLVPVGKTAMDFKKMIMVNESGAFMWNKMQDEFSLESIIDNILEEYDVTFEEARADVIDFFDKLKSLGIINEIA